MTRTILPTPRKAAQYALTLATLAIGTVAAYWAYLVVKQEHILFMTHRLPESVMPENFRSYSQAVPGGQVRGLIYSPLDPEAMTDMVVYVPGRGEDARTTGRAVALWLLPGFGFASLNYRGVANSEGLPTEVAAVNDFCQLADHLRQVYPFVRLHLVGRSLGTGVAVQLAARQEFASVQLVTPYDSLIEVARKRFPFVPLDWLLRHQFNSMEHCKTVAAKTQVLLAETDDVVEHAHSQRLIDAWPTPIRAETIANTDHHSIVASERTWMAVGVFALAVSEPAQKLA
ncbi:alpha/beta hydrolase [Variovorax paradoxus]|nr:alpha/beta hydrolase [Variovorax paradoxus]